MFVTVRPQQQLAFVLVLMVAAGFVNTVKLPNYITPCKRNDPELNLCVKNQIISVLPRILEGDKSLKLPPMKPFKLPEVKLETAGNLKIKLIDLEIYGLEDNEVNDASLDVKQQHFQMKIHMNRLNLLSQYEIDGRILVLPISGNGPCNITFVGGDFTFDIDYDLEVRNGKEYLKLKNPKLIYATQREYYHFDNLFNGDKRLGEEMNKILDENWQVVATDLQPAVSKAVISVALLATERIFSLFPYSVVLPV